MREIVLSACQPYFAPFPAFFQRAHHSDIFLVLDDVQFPRGTTWVSRNRFKAHFGTLWITIPVWKKGLGLQRMDQVRIANEGRWPYKYFHTLTSAYGRAPYLHEHLGILERMFSGEFERLLDLNMMLIAYLFRHLNIEADLTLSSELHLRGRGTSRLVEACKKTGATHFMAQRAAMKSIDPRPFTEAGVALDFMPPARPVYPQLWGDFLTNLSAFDLLLNCGPKSHDILFRKETRSGH